MIENPLRKYFVLLTATLSFFVVGLSLFSYPTISSEISAMLSLTNTQSGLITSSFSIAYALLQIPGGVLSDRYGGKALSISLVSAALSPLIFILGSGYESALISRAIDGASCGIIVPTSVRMISTWFARKELNRAMGIFTSGWALSNAFSFLVFPILLEGTHWKVPLYFVTAFSLIVLVISLISVRWKRIDYEKRVTTDSQRPRVALRDLLTRNLFFIILPNFAGLAITVGIASWTPIFLTSKLGFSNVDAGVAVALLGIFAVFGSFGGGYLAQRIGGRKTILISMALATVFPIILGISMSSGIAEVSISIIGVASVLYVPPTFALVPFVSKRGPEVAGIEFGIFNMISNFGSFVAPIVFGYILDIGGGFTYAFAIMGSIGILGIIGGLFLRESELYVQP